MKYLFLVMLIISGCATSTKALRETKPTNAKVFRGNYEEVAKCSLEKMDEAFMAVSNLRINEKKSNARIVAHSTHLGSDICEFSFTQEGDDRVLVESRGRMEMFSRDRYPSKVWPLIDECSNGMTVDRKLK